MSDPHNQILISLFDSHFVFSVQGSFTHIHHEQGDPAQSQSQKSNSVLQCPAHNIQERT
jgi:hypothetical protein